MKTSEKLYHRYEYLAKKYASRIYSYEQLSFEYEDLVQEFKIKIFTSIKAYGRRWLKFQRNEASKPVPLKYYLEAACGNKARDFMKYISLENHKVRIDEINYDFGVEVDTRISPENNQFELNGIDLLEGLSGKERAIFSMHLKGYAIRVLNKVYKSKTNKPEDDEPFTALDVIEIQKEYLLSKYGDELSRTKTMYSSYSLDEE